MIYKFFFEIVSAQEKDNVFEYEAVCTKNEAVGALLITSEVLEVGSVLDSADILRLSQG